MNGKTADVIVIGAGPAGVSAAITIARAGRKVLVIERGDKAGDKNMFGGCIYETPTAEIFPDFKNSAPIERRIKDNKIFLLTDKESFDISHKYPEKDGCNSYTVIRSKWDEWCISQAEKEGVYFAPKTVARSLIKVNGVFCGVETDKEKLYADIIILADGVNSLLAKQAGLRKDYSDKSVTINVKEVYKLSRDIIDERFNLNDNEGTAARVFGGPLKNMFSMGFIYTNKDTVSIGVGIAQDEAKKHKIKPYELLDKMKSHPSIAPLIKDGELIEYSAHLIPEGSYDNLPKLYDNRIMVVGDAACLVNNLHLEGTNLAMLSGKLAGETALLALNALDCSATSLSLYSKKLKESIIIKDLKTHNDTVDFMKKHISVISDDYPQLACEFVDLISVADKTPKGRKFSDFFLKIIKSGVIPKSIPLGIFALRKCIKK